MKYKHRQFGFSCKAVGDDGTFEGYGSVFGNADSYRDVVMPGAFANSLVKWKEQGALPPCLWQHQTDQPIGPFLEMAEDGKGLYVRGQLLINDVPQARVAYALLKSKTIRGMSIGYNVERETYNGKTQVNELEEIDLWECSLATFPANTEAMVTSVKSIIASGKMPAPSEFEEILRDAGFSRKHAKAITSQGYAQFLAQRDADDGKTNDDALFDEVMASIKSFKVA